jgi:1-acyl-sn-glycerol-3-phosphate acyltransferase
MQLYRFMFLTRSWAADRMYLGRHLDKLAKRAQASGEPFSLMVFPEGTLVSANTRPLSKKYADKMGIVSFRVTCAGRSAYAFCILS